MCDALWSLAEAPCKHVVSLARAEVRGHPDAPERVKEFARIREGDAEKGMQRVLKKYGLLASVPVNYHNVGTEGQPCLMPYIKPSSWVSFLMNSSGGKRLARQMVGVPNFSVMHAVLAEFWKRYRALYPGHPLFGMADAREVNLRHCIPYFTHTDEGRSYKHAAIWVMSFHGALGRGTRAWLKSGAHKVNVRANGMGMNYTGKTWSTQFMFSTCTKKVYLMHANAIPDLVKIFSDDAEMLFNNGITSSDGRRRVHLVPLGTKGDLPALKVLSGAKRSYSNVPRSGSSKKGCKGVCFLCDAGVEADPGSGGATIPFEDVNDDAAWIATLHLNPPWDQRPAIVSGFGFTEQECMDFFKTDTWHNLHLGILKRFLASSFVCIIESADYRQFGGPPGSVDKKFEWMTSIYRAFCQSQKFSPFVPEISRDTLGYPASTTEPVGKWTKAMASTQMMVFLDHFCQSYVVGKTQDALLLSIVSLSRLAPLFIV